MIERRRREMSIEQVQHWVLTALICAVSSFPIGALIIVTHINRDKGQEPAAAVMLCVMTGVIGVIAMVAIRLVHRTSPFSFLLVLGVLPALGSAVWTWGF